MTDPARARFRYISAACLTLFLALPAAAQSLRVTTDSLPSGRVGEEYSVNLGAAGGDRPYRWSVTGGSLPDGLSLSSSGVIHGTPRREGSFSFTVRVRDHDDEVATGRFTITIVPSLAVTTGSLPAGVVGVTYSATLSASGGTPPYTWSVSGGLPSGLSLSGAAISGTPSAAGTSSFTVQVRDSQGATASRQLSIAVSAPPLQVTTASLAEGTVGTAYSATLSASGGTPPYTWSASGSLPAGLSLSGATISGTPAAAGAVSFTVQARDSQGATASRALSITINPPALQIATASLAEGTVGMAYSATLLATGGTPPYTWSVSGGLPAGLSLSGATISGTPAAAGAASFTVQARDSRGATASRQLSINISAPSLQVTTSTLPAGTVGTPYSATLTASGGTPPYGWALSGSLPAGLTLSGAEIAGTPSAAGTFSFTVHASDGRQTAARDLSIAIGGPSLQIATASLPGGTVGTPYSATLAASGGTPPYTWALIGTPPPGLSLAGASLAGTPTAPGSFIFTVQVSAGQVTVSRRLAVMIEPRALEIATLSLPPATVGVTYSQRLSAVGGTPPYAWAITGGAPPGLAIAGDTLAGVPAAAMAGSLGLQVTDSAGVSATRDIPFAVAPPPLQVATASLPAATLGVPYNQPLSATGGTPPYTWTGGSTLPPGLALADSSVSGTPAAAGTFSFEAVVSDSASGRASRILTVTVGASVNIATASLEDGSVGAPYFQALRATGGSPPYTWSLASGTLPEGLALNAAAGVISGVPLAAGSYNFTIRVRDAAGAEAAREFAIKTAAGLMISSAPVLPGGTAGALYAHTLAATGGSTPYAWSIASGALPGGLTLDAASGALGGTPAGAGQFRFTAVVSDSAGSRATKEFTLSVAPGLAISSAPGLPDGGSGATYSQPLQAAGGTPPYLWSVEAGALPPGLELDGTAGLISGVPAAAGVFTFTARVTDSLTASAEKQFQLRILPGLAITSAPPAQALFGSAYAHTLAASGGVPPYRWSLTAGSLPPGLVLDGAAGTISGTALSTGNFAFTLRVADAGGLSTTREDVLMVGLPGVPSAAINGGADVLEPLQQPIVSVALAAPYPAQVQGELTLTFEPDADVPGDDPAVQFATGGRTAAFTIPAGATTASFTVPAMAFQSGTVAGTIRLTMAMRSGTTDLTPPGGAARQMRILRSAPAIRSAMAAQTATGFEVRITGISPARELASAGVRLTGIPGGGLQTTGVTVPLGEVAARWFGDAAARPFGSQFMLIVPFAVQGDVGSIDTITVTLINRSGASEPAVLKLAR